jgi:hypothetical protein
VTETLSKGAKIAPLPCPCGATPIVRKGASTWSVRCPKRIPGNGWGAKASGCLLTEVRYGRTEAIAIGSWNNFLTVGKPCQPDGRVTCLRCGLTEPHLCLQEIGWRNGDSNCSAASMRRQIR